MFLNCLLLLVSTTAYLLTTQIGCVEPKNYRHKKLDRKIPQLTLNSLRQKSPFGINDGSKDIGSKLERFMCPSILSEPKIYPNIIYIVNY